MVVEVVVVDAVGGEQLVDDVGGIALAGADGAGVTEIDQTAVVGVVGGGGVEVLVQFDDVRAGEGVNGQLVEWVQHWDGLSSGVDGEVGSAAARGWRPPIAVGC